MNYMNAKLIDTNILVYAYDSSEGEKHRKAAEIVSRIWEEGGGVLCIQNLMEFFVVITRKVQHTIQPQQASVIIRDAIESENWMVIERHEQTLLSAIDLSMRHDLHLWDAAIAACMLENNIRDILTEDTKHFDRIPQVNAATPF